MPECTFYTRMLNKTFFYNKCDKKQLVAFKVIAPEISWKFNHFSILKIEITCLRKSKLQNMQNC